MSWFWNEVTGRQLLYFWLKCCKNPERFVLNERLVTFQVWPNWLLEFKFQQDQFSLACFQRPNSCRFAAMFGYSWLPLKYYLQVSVTFKLSIHFIALESSVLPFSMRFIFHGLWAFQFHLSFVSCIIFAWLLLWCSQSRWPAGHYAYMFDSSNMMPIKWHILRNVGSSVFCSATFLNRH